MVEDFCFLNFLNIANLLTSISKMSFYHHPFSFQQTLVFEADKEDYKIFVVLFSANQLLFLLLTAEVCHNTKIAGDFYKR